jgi:hypothetical protein
MRFQIFGATGHPAKDFLIPDGGFTVPKLCNRVDVSAITRVGQGSVTVIPPREANDWHGALEIVNANSEVEVYDVTVINTCNREPKAVHLHGSPFVSPTGIRFDGAIDYVTISAWDYAIDARFTVSFWMQKEDCRSYPESIYSHQAAPLEANVHDPQTHLMSMQYIGISFMCNSNADEHKPLFIGRQSSFGNDISIIRLDMQDDSGTVANLDFPLHASGAFDSITSVWVHEVVSVIPASISSYNDGAVVSKWTYGYCQDCQLSTRNTAFPNAEVLQTKLTGFTLKSDVYLGSAPGQPPTFKGTIAMLAVDTEPVNAQQAACYFRGGEAEFSLMADLSSTSNVQASVSVTTRSVLFPLVESTTKACGQLIDSNEGHNTDGPDTSICATSKTDKNGVLTCLSGVSDIGSVASRPFSVCSPPGDLPEHGYVSGASGESTKYANGLDCRMVITSPPGMRVKLEVHSLNLEAGHDFVQIYDGDNIDALLMESELMQSLGMCCDDDKLGVADQCSCGHLYGKRNLESRTFCGLTGQRSADSFGHDLMPSLQGLYSARESVMLRLSTDCETSHTAGFLIYYQFVEHHTSKISKVMNDEQGCARSCHAALQAEDALESGVYLLCGEPNFKVFCDMETSGGGWTMVMNVNPVDGNLVGYGKDFWTGQHEYGSFDQRFSRDYKSPAAYLLEASEILIQSVAYPSRSEDMTAFATAPIRGWRRWPMTTVQTFGAMFSTTCCQHDDSDCREHTWRCKTGPADAADVGFTDSYDDVIRRGSCIHTDQQFGASSATGGGTVLRLATFAGSNNYDAIGGFGGCMGCGSAACHAEGVHGIRSNAGMDRIPCSGTRCESGVSSPLKNPVTGAPSECQQSPGNSHCSTDDTYGYNTFDTSAHTAWTSRIFVRGAAEAELLLCNPPDILPTKAHVSATSNSNAHYVDGLDCRMVVTAPVGHVVRIEVESLRLEAQHDFLQILDGDGIGAPLLRSPDAPLSSMTACCAAGSEECLTGCSNRSSPALAEQCGYTGESSPPGVLGMLLSSGRSVTLRFSTDCMESLPLGFALRYQFVEHKQCLFDLKYAPTSDTFSVLPWGLGPSKSATFTVQATDEVRIGLFNGTADEYDPHRTIGNATNSSSSASSVMSSLQATHSTNGQGAGWCQQLCLAGRALDGNAGGGDFESGTCTHTQQAENTDQWWQVDLGSVGIVTSIDVFHRTDAGTADRLVGAQVIVSSDTDYARGQVCGILNQAGAQPESLSCYTSGKYVTIRVLEASLKFVSLCEVEIHRGMALADAKSPVYEIVLSNAGSTIRRASEQVYGVSVPTPYIFGDDPTLRLWIDALNGLVRVGHGGTVGGDVIMQWQDSDRHVSITHVGIKLSRDDYSSECQSTCRFVQGQDGFGGYETHIGETRTAALCAALVQQVANKANGAKFSVNGTTCFAKFGMTGSEESLDWQTCQFRDCDRRTDASEMVWSACLLDDSTSFVFVGDNYCRGGGHSYVNGRRKTGIHTTSACSDECEDQHNCIGYSYSPRGPGGQCFLHGPGLEHGLPEGDVLNFETVATVGWESFSQVAVSIESAGGMGTAVCFKKRGTMATPAYQQENFLSTFVESTQGFPHSALACAEIGARLCTAAELEQKVGLGGGCGHDREHAWSSSSCRADDQSGIVSVQGDGAGTRCEIDSTAQFATICCADATVPLSDIEGNIKAPYFGSGSDGKNLASLMQSYGTSKNTEGLVVTLSNLQIGTAYRLQLLFYEPQAQTHLGCYFAHSTQEPGDGAELYAVSSLDECTEHCAGFIFFGLTNWDCSSTPANQADCYCSDMLPNVPAPASQCTKCNQGALAGAFCGQCTWRISFYQNEDSGDRTAFDVRMGGETFAASFHPAALQANGGGAIITHEFVAKEATNDVTLSPLTPDQGRAYLNAFTLKQLSSASGKEELNLALGLASTPCYNDEVEHGVRVCGATRQTNVLDGGEPSRAIDGDTEGVFGAGSCTHTSAHAPPTWWQLDLGHILTIDRVSIYHRTDCCQDRLMDAAVIVSGTPNFYHGQRCDSLSDFTKIPEVAECGQSYGQYITIKTSASPFITICEVEVWGDATNSHSATEAAFSPISTQTNAFIGAQPNEGADFIAANQEHFVLAVDINGPGGLRVGDVIFTDEVVASRGNTECSFVAGEGVGGGEANLGDATDAEACVQLVQAIQPHANGATFSNFGGHQCLAEFGMTAASGDRKWQTCIFGEELSASANSEHSCSFVTGDGVSERTQLIGVAESAAVCAQMIAEMRPSATGVTFEEAESNCFAEFGMTGTNGVSGWLTCWLHHNFSPTSCTEVLELNPSAADGTYDILVDGVPTSVFCDMTTADGGWVLVYNIVGASKMMTDEPVNVEKLATNGEILSTNSSGKLGRDSIAELCTDQVTNIVQYYTKFSSSIVLVCGKVMPLTLLLSASIVQNDSSWCC